MVTIKDGVVIISETYKTKEDRKVMREFYPGSTVN